jgi:predicted O-methyltransferase YrrM
MAYLEAIDRQDRVDGTPRSKRLRQVPPETGKFLALMAAGAPDGAILEIGASAGYSSLWLILACLQRGGRLVTFEASPDKARLALETFKQAQVETHVQLIQGDAHDYLSSYHGVSFCFLDAEKEIYQTCYDMVVPNLVPGGLFLADNVISHQETLQTMLEHASADERVDALIIPIGKGVLLCRRL